MCLLTEGQLSQLNFGIDRGIPLKIHLDKTGSCRSEFLGNQDYFSEISSADYRERRIQKIAECLTSTLDNTNHADLKSAEQSLVVKTAKKFCQKTAKQIARAPCIDSLKRQLLASRLVIPVKAFSANPGFYEFASKNYLYHYLRQYNHRLKVNPKTFELKILYENKWRVWSEIKETLTKPIDKPKNQPKQSWVYGPKGAQNKDMYHWKELTPYKYDAPEKWGKRWVLEFCTCNESSPQKTGDHSWFRLKTPNGEIYSIGLYRPEKSGVLSNFNEPFKIKKGHLMQPDLSEYYPCNIHTIEYAINEETFKKIKHQVEEDKRKDEELFQAIEINCTQYVNKVAGLAGIYLPTKKRIWRFITPRPIENLIDTVAPYIPAFIKKICDVTAAVFLNMLMVFLGATKSDPIVVNGSKLQVRPHIVSFWDLFNPDKASLHHPHTLGWEVHRLVNKWRESELKKLQTRHNQVMEHHSKENESSKKEIYRVKKRMENIRFDLPPTYKKTLPTKS